MKKEKVESILEVARHMFRKYGIKKTNLEEIARLSKVAKATIYNYFGSKDQVYLEVLNREVMDLVAHLSEAVGQMTSPLDKLRVFVFTSFKLVRETADIFNHRSEFMDRLISGTDNIRKTVFAKQIAILQTILQEGFKEGVFSNDSPLTARSILYAVRGMELTWLLDPHNTEVDADIERLFDLLCTGILTKREVPCV